MSEGSLSEEVIYEKKPEGRERESKPCGSVTKEVKISVVAICIAEKWMGGQYGWNRKNKETVKEVKLGR